MARPEMVRFGIFWILKLLGIKSPPFFGFEFGDFDGAFHPLLFRGVEDFRSKGTDDEFPFLADPFRHHGNEFQTHLRTN